MEPYIMSITNRRVTSIHLYMLYSMGHVLSKVDNIQYLPIGITITSNLHWENTT